VPAIASEDDAQRARIAELFRDYQRTRERRLRNELIEAHRPLAVRLARRYSNRGVPFDDLLQVAQLGMLKAVERFDPERSHEFASFANATVCGELKRYFRDRTWAVRVPRATQELHLRLAPVIADLTQQLRRSPTVAELAEALRCSEDAVLEAFEAGSALRHASIDVPGADGQASCEFERVLGEVDHGFATTETRVLIENLMARLPARERTILELRFFHDLTQAEIAQRVGISQMHVSRLLASVLHELRTRV
jgi:RNA polymerase sigma-B factor